MVRNWLSVIMALAPLAVGLAPARAQVQQPAPQIQRQQPQLQRQQPQLQPQLAPGQCTSPDRVQAIALSINPPQPTNGQVVSVALTIRNVCNGTLASVPWRIYVRTVAGSNPVDLGSGVQQNVPAGASFTVTANWTATPGQSSLGGQADPANVFGETDQNRSNNYKEYGLNVPQISTGTAVVPGIGKPAPLASAAAPQPSGLTSTVPPRINAFFPGYTCAVGCEEAQAGAVYFLTRGSWTGYGAVFPTIVDQWQRCDASNLNCVNIAGATGDRYQLQAADVGWTIRVSEMATAGTLSAVQRSSPTAVVTAVWRGPFAVVRPSIPVGFRVGQTLTVETGLFGGWPHPTFTFAWDRCFYDPRNPPSTPITCQPIAGATGQAYTPTEVDTGGYLVVKVVAANGHGSFTDVLRSNPGP